MEGEMAMEVVEVMEEEEEMVVEVAMDLEMEVERVQLVELVV